MRLGIWMLAAASLSACSSTPPAGTAATWTIDQTTTDGAVLGVWGSRPDDVWAVGGQSDRSLVLHGDGSTWTPIEVSTDALLYSVYGFSDSDVYAVGEHGLILHYDGITWQRVESGTTMTLFGLWGASGDDVWIVGGDISNPPGSAVVRRGAVDSFSPIDLPTDLAPNVLFKAHGFAADQVMMVGADGAVLRWNGTQWSRDAVPTIEPLRSTWGRGDQDVYAVGGSDMGEVLHFDGWTWSQAAQLLTGEGLNGVFTSSNGPTIAVGPQDVFELELDGALHQAALPPLAPESVLHGVWGDDVGTTYVVGGTLYAYPGAMTGTILTRR
jgi:photosystem II stability/assembly factor-like uncharacterized protein